MGLRERLRREVIGNPECPVMHRWTLVGNTGENLESPSCCKVLVHHFLPNGDDPDPHDHPRSFVTLILRGGYVDETTEGREIMSPGKLRFRRATHTHRTLIGRDGCWSLVIMGPLERPWGFVWDGRWWPWRKYLAERGEEATRCPS